jgi:hypothetical protein
MKYLEAAGLRAEAHFGSDAGGDQRSGIDADTLRTFVLLLYGAGPGAVRSSPTG